MPRRHRGLGRDGGVANRPRLGAGVVGVRVSSREAVVDAVAISAVQQGTCTTVYR